jgi:hypothetical protein
VLVRNVNKPRGGSEEETEFSKKGKFEEVIYVALMLNSNMDWMDGEDLL